MLGVTGTARGRHGWGRQDSAGRLFWGCSWGPWALALLLLLLLQWRWGCCCCCCCCCEAGLPGGQADLGGLLCAREGLQGPVHHLQGGKVQWQGGGAEAEGGTSMQAVCGQASEDGLASLARPADRRAGCSGPQGTTWPASLATCFAAWGGFPLQQPNSQGMELQDSMGLPGTAPTPLFIPQPQIQRPSSLSHKPKTLHPFSTGPKPFIP